MALFGIPAVRMGALCFARHGRTKAQLVEFLQDNLNVSVRQISRQIRELAITEDGDGRLCLPANVIPTWRDVLPVPEKSEIATNEGAA